ncbi:MAG TPA: sensory rhodopsin transducer [Streptosporangiaceae bacterium]
MTGKTTWWFPDGDLPEPVPGDRFVSHESLMVLNPNEVAATISLVFYWEDHPPTRVDGLVVEAERVRCIRIDQLAGVTIPYRTQYAIKLESDTGVFVSYGRLDTAQPNFALVGLMGAGE